MATEGILTDTGTIYRRLLNHRPVVQIEVHCFVKEFEGKRGDDDLQALQGSMTLANEMEAIFLEEIMSVSPWFRQIREQTEEIVGLCNDILKREKEDLTIPQQEQNQFDQQIEDYRGRLLQEQEAYDTRHSEEVERLKEEIRVLKDSYSWLRTTSVGSTGSPSASLHSQSASSQDLEQSHSGTENQSDSSHSETADKED